jgi:hypothetical protein
MLSSTAKVTNFNSQQSGAINATTGVFTTSVSAGASSLDAAGNINCRNILYAGQSGISNSVVQLGTGADWQNQVYGISLGSTYKSDGETYIGFTQNGNTDPTGQFFTGIRFGPTYNYNSQGGYLAFNTAGPYGDQSASGNGEKMRITKAGNVGINTNSPSAVLHVQNNQNGVNTLNVYGPTPFDATNIVNIQNQASAYGRNNLVLTGRFEGNNDSWAFNTPRNGIVFKTQSSLNSGATQRFAIQNFASQLGVLSNGMGNTPVMTWNDNGNVGVGLANPSYKMHVYGGNGIGVDGSISVQSNGHIYFNDADPGDMVVRRYAAGTGDRYGLGQYAGGILRMFASNAFGGSAIRFSLPTNDDMSGAATFNDLVSINHNAQMSIGTTNAENNRLALATNNGENTGISLSDSTKSTGVCYVGITVPANGQNVENGFGFSGMKLGAPQGAASGYVAFHTHWANVAEAERMRITKEGNVGIGIVNPVKLLDVNGDALVRGVLNVSGASNLAAVNAAGTVTAAGDFYATSGTAFFGGLYAGNITTSGGLNIGAASVLGDVSAGNITAGGNLNVSGVATLGSVYAANITASGALNVSGASVLAGVSAANITASALNVSGASVLAGVSASNITASGTLNVSGMSTLTGGVSTSTVAASNVTGVSAVTLANGLTINSYTGALSNNMTASLIPGANITGSIWLTSGTGVGYIYISDGNVLRQI